MATRQGQRGAQQPATTAAEAPQQQVEAPVPTGAERTRTRRTYAPRTDIFETEQALVLAADMPGVMQDDLDITLERRELTIRGRTADYAPEGYSPVYGEYESGDYERTFVVSDEIDADKIEARLKDGVLHLTLPKAAAAQAKRIQVRSA